LGPDRRQIDELRRVAIYRDGHTRENPDSLRAPRATLVEYRGRDSTVRRRAGDRGRRRGGGRRCRHGCGSGGCNPGTALLAVSFPGRLRRRLQDLDLAPGQRWIVHDAADQRFAARTDRELVLDGNDVGLVGGDELDGFAHLVFGEDLKRAV
jgi:hypothetical protein